MTNIDKLEKIFPECITETEDTDGNLIRAVDFEHLKQILSDELLDGREAYVFNFVGKKRAEFEAHKKIKATLRPIITESRDFDTTKNLYIEGDNLDALKILQESYLGKVKMIYIDPPYNTGNDFIYRDDFKQDADDFDDAAQTIDDNGNRILNRESRGRFHSDWCAMIYSRLLIAKNFLSNDGVIFISIDDHELANLKKICDEIFGERNFVEIFSWKKTETPANLSIRTKKAIEYIICYTKSDKLLKFRGLKKTSKSSNGLMNQTNAAKELIFPSHCVDTALPDGIYRKQEYGTATYKIILLEDTEVKDGYFIKPIKLYGKFKWSQENLNKEIARGTKISIRTIAFSPSYEKSDYEPEVPWNLIDKSFGVKTNEQATADLRQLFDGAKVFDFPKPVSLLSYLINFICDTDSIVMDFFSGSATTAHAVMELNVQDGGNRQFIMIQIPEQTPDNSEARRAGFNTICEIGKERIRRAGDKLKEKYPALDVGFRVFKVDSSNFKDLPRVWTPQTIMDFVENIKDDRDEWDLLFGTLIDTGRTIDLAVASEEIDGVKVLKCAGGEILASFDKNIPAEVFRKLARREPQKIFFRDASFASSADKINALEFFRNFAPNTEVKVL